jgi:hypothetical protein
MVQCGISDVILGAVAKDVGEGTRRGGGKQPL